MKRTIESTEPLHVLSLFDAVHGVIDLHQLGGRAGLSEFLNLMTSPYLDRLRRIKLLGYAAHQYPAADHSRYAHAVGTMHAMSLLLARLENTDALGKGVFKQLKIFDKPPIAKSADLRKHMLVAALLQDIGELPYGDATSKVYVPHQDLKATIEHTLGSSVIGWPAKSIFTASAICELPQLQEMDINFSFLIYLITGYPRYHSTDTKLLRTLRQMLDGSIDADRLDYVYRDAHHTIGARWNLRSVVDCLLRYQEDGPVFAEPGPVAEFLAMRASLWTNVYHSPPNRFRIVLLVVLLRDILDHPTTALEFFGNSGRAELNRESFISLDDFSLTAKLLILRDHKAELSRQGQIALDLLLGYITNYEWWWLPVGGDKGPSKAIALPDELFFDTYADYREHSLYKQGSIWVEASRFRWFKPVLALEECCGAFTGMLSAPSSSVEKPGSVLLYVPRNPKKRQGGAWNSVMAAIKDGGIVRVLRENDPLIAGPYPNDTRPKTDFLGPDIFISYTWADVEFVDRIKDVLFEGSRRYYLYRNDEGLGERPTANSVKAAKSAGAALVIASEEYQRRAQDETVLKSEFRELVRRAREDEVKVVFLCVDNRETLREFLSRVFEPNEPPFVGNPLRNTSKKDLASAIDVVLAYIDGIAKDIRSRKSGSSKKK